MSKGGSTPKATTEEKQLAQLAAKGYAQANALNVGTNYLKTEATKTDRSDRYAEQSNSNAAAVMEALRDRFATLGYEQNPALKVSLSIGLAAFNPGHSDATLWLSDADRALYEAKTTGRNRVICCSDGRSQYELLDSV